MSATSPDGGSTVSASPSGGSSAAPTQPVSLPAPGGGGQTVAAVFNAAPAKFVWPQFRGPGGQGKSSDSGVPVTWSSSENIVWKTQLPGAGTSSPIVAGDRIYITSYSGFNVPGSSGREQDLKLHLSALSLQGELLWDTPVTPSLPEQDNIREEHGYSSATPAADADRIYVFFGKTGVLAFDHSGKQLWKTSVGNGLNGWGSSNSPVLFEDMVIVNASVESESLYALDAKTGTEKWRARGIRESWNTPILVPTADGKTELVVAIFRNLLGFDPHTGEQLWKCDTKIDWYMVPSLVSHGDVVYCVGGRGSGGALAVRTGGRGDVIASHRLWSGAKGTNVPSPIYHDGHLYWVHDVLGIAYCADATTGQLVYEERIPNCGQVYSSPVLADGRIYVMNRVGKTFVLPAKPSFEVLAENSLGERGIYNASFAVAGSRIYLRTNQNLYCIGK